jgi:N-sulfoglucosamine sulfohydrolase
VPTLLDYAGGYDAKLGAAKPKVAMMPKSRGTKKGPYKFHGRSFLPILAEKNPKDWDTIYASHTFHEIQMYYPMRVVRDRKYKLIWNIAHPLPYPFASDLWAAPTWQAQWKLGPSAKYGKRTVREYIHRPKFELYDISADPHESKNLADDKNFAKVLVEYQAKLKKFQEDTRDPWVLKWRYE